MFFPIVSSYYSEQSLMSLRLSQNHEKIGGAGLRARQPVGPNA
jgi:hypothetical protein